MKKIYLAGPDVFRPDAKAYGEQLTQLCKKYGFIGLYPLDNQVPAGLGKHEMANWIYLANIKLIQDADYVMANANLFRGHEPDSGTMFEVGYAIALNKKVWLYTSESKPMTEQAVTAKEENGVFFDQEGQIIEDFDHNLNLMLACSSSTVIGDAEKCLQAISKHLSEQ